jgi:hypothetical protein
MPFTFLAEKAVNGYGYPQALPLRLKKNLSVFFTLSENILPEKYVPATLLFISPRVG